jgi:hypothetical protein
MPARKKTAAPAKQPKQPAKETRVEETPPEAEAPKQRKAREVGPATQKVIDRILDMRRSGMGLPTIAKTLNEEGVPTFGSGKTWYPPVVRGICLRHGVERGEKPAEQPTEKTTKEETPSEA